MGAAVWRTRTGIIRSSGTVSLDVEVYPTPQDFGVSSVVFAVSKDGGMVESVVASAPNLRTPNYSDASSPLAGVAPGGMARTFAYGIDLAVSSFFQKAEITATVVYSSGRRVVVPFGPIIVYRSSSEIRPNTATRYCDYDNGSDSTGDGSYGNPYKTLRKAVDAVLATSPTRDGGGGRVVVKPCELIWFGNGGLGDWYTSEHWPLTIEFMDGVVIRTKDDGTESPIFGAYGINASNNRNYIRLTGSGGVNAAKVGSSFDVPNPLRHPLIWTGYRNSDNFSPGGWGAGYFCNIWLWIDGLRCGSQYWTPGKVSLRYDEPTEPSGLWFSISGADATVRKWGSCLRVEGASDHIVDFMDAQDCVAQDCSVLFFGGSTQNTDVDEEMSYSLCNVVAHDMKIGVEAEKGYVDLLPDDAGDLVASTQSGGAFSGKLRIDHATDNVFGTRFGLIAHDKVSTLTNFQEIVGAQRQGVDAWYCFVRGWATVEALGTYVVSGIYAGLEGARFRVLETGLNGSGRPYCILDAVGTSSSCPSTARVFSGDIDLTWAPHGGTDHMFQAPKKFVDSIRSNVAIFDTDGTQGPFMEVVAMKRVAFVNYNHYSFQASGYPPNVVPGIYYCPWSHTGMVVDELIIAHCSWGGTTYFNSSQTWTNILVVNNAFHELSTDGPSHSPGPPNWRVVSHNNFQVGTVKGINTNLDGGVGSRWYADEPVDGTHHSFRPSAYGFTLPTVQWFPTPVAFMWTGVVTVARGGWQNAGEQTWSTTPAAPELVGSTPSAIVVSALAAGTMATGTGSDLIGPAPAPLQVGGLAGGTLAAGSLLYAPIGAPLTVAGPTPLVLAGALCLGSAPDALTVGVGAGTVDAGALLNGDAFDDVDVSIDDGGVFGPVPLLFGEGFDDIEVETLADGTLEVEPGISSGPMFVDVSGPGSGSILVGAKLTGLFNVQTLVSAPLGLMYTGVVPPVVPVVVPRQRAMPRGEWWQNPLSQATLAILRRIAGRK